jgi:hypothetical protein
MSAIGQKRTRSGRAARLSASSGMLQLLDNIELTRCRDVSINYGFDLEVPNA